ncbi:hypothetical protein RRG08_052289 [Elysia crispata]|uniref:Uncharacterized protein n=1 Tax=Elysia crispata TaxID=231223 RepID=A0AAE1DPR0_9GAST|nr:hypothetical protein RRG08_052289 [Elysia crispata]
MYVQLAAWRHTEPKYLVYTHWSKACRSCRQNDRNVSRHDIFHETRAVQQLEAIIIWSPPRGKNTVICLMLQTKLASSAELSSDDQNSLSRELSRQRCSCGGKLVVEQACFLFLTTPSPANLHGRPDP